MNAVFFLCYNHTVAQFEMCQRAFSTFLAQDVGPLEIWAVNNGSAQPTIDWLNTLDISPHLLHVVHYQSNTAPTVIANRIVGEIFAAGHSHILSSPSDAILPSNLYSELLKWPRGMVAAHMNNGTEEYSATPIPRALHEDFYPSVVLTRKWAYDALVSAYGYFLDEGFFMYANDVDMKLRMAAVGVHGLQLDIQCGHFGSVCWRLNTPENAKAITDRANGDRFYFFQKWGFYVGSDQYIAALSNVNFRGKPNAT